MCRLRPKNSLPTNSGYLQTSINEQHYAYLISIKFTSVNIELFSAKLRTVNQIVGSRAIGVWALIHSKVKLRTSPKVSIIIQFVSWSSHLPPSIAEMLSNHPRKKSLSLFKYLVFGQNLLDSQFSIVEVLTPIIFATSFCSRHLSNRLFFRYSPIVVGLSGYPNGFGLFCINWILVKITRKDSDLIRVSKKLKVGWVHYSSAFCPVASRPVKHTPTHTT